jgi:hypothetical protein
MSVQAGILRLDDAPVNLDVLEGLRQAISQSRPDGEVHLQGSLDLYGLPSLPHNGRVTAPATTMSFARWNRVHV